MLEESERYKADDEAIAKKVEAKNARRRCVWMVEGGGADGSGGGMRGRRPVGLWWVNLPLPPLPTTPLPLSPHPRWRPSSAAMTRRRSRTRSMRPWSGAPWDYASRSLLSLGVWAARVDRRVRLHGFGFGQKKE